MQATGIADKVIIEEYEGQKIDDIRKYGVDIFTVGSDWVGYFDYLNEYCKVVYLPRTEGVSSSEIRAERASVSLGMVGYAPFLRKFYNESKFVNAVDVIGLCIPEEGVLDDLRDTLQVYTSDYSKLLENVEAVYIHSHPELHYKQCKMALEQGKHVMCESPIAMSKDESDELLKIAEKKGLTLMEATRTAYITAYARMLLLLKGGKIGNSIHEDELIPDALEILKEAKEKGVNISLSVATVAGQAFDNDTPRQTVDIFNIPDGWEGMDASEASLENWKKIILESKTILWNGPVGVFELPNFAHGTEEIAKFVAEATQNGAYSLVGGGDSVAAVTKMGFADKVSYVSTGGGAMLEAIEGKDLPGIAAIRD